MRRKFLIALGLIGVFVVAGLAGCSKNDLGVEPRVQLKGLAGFGKPDTTPKPPPPPDTTLIPAEWVSSDSTAAGTTGASHWLLRGGKKPFTTTWILMADPSWPGYPIQGTVRLTPNKTVPLSVPIAVPASAISGIYLLQIQVTTPTGPPYTAFGQIRVFGNDSTPPPPPPPAVMFQFSDSVQAGMSANTYWQVTNESNHPFTMDWALAAASAWPGFPIQGSVALGPNESQQLIVSVPVPDTTSAGVHGIEMQVTRPDGLPPASSPGFILVSP